MGWFIPALLTGASAAMNIFGASKSAKASKEAGKLNYRLLMKNAENIEKQTADDLSMFRKQSTSFLSTQRQRLGLSGVKLEYSPEKITSYDMKSNESRPAKASSLNTLEAHHEMLKGEALDNVMGGYKYSGGDELVKRKTIMELPASDTGSAALLVRQSVADIEEDAKRIINRGLIQAELEREKAKVSKKTGQTQATAAYASAFSSGFAGLANMAMGFSNYSTTGNWWGMR